MKIAIDLNDVIRDYTGQFIKQYIKFVDEYFEITPEEVTDIDFFNVFPFQNREEYERFKYVDNPFELYGRSEAMDKMLPYKFLTWLETTMRDFEDEKTPEIMFVSPLETNLTIQSTMAFLAKLPSRVREIYFPKDSSTVWDRCDVLITANPLFLNNVPENKIVVKIEMPYNKDIECKYTFKSMLALIEDENNVFFNLVDDNG